MDARAWVDMPLARASIHLAALSLEGGEDIDFIRGGKMKKKRGREIDASDDDER